MIDYDDLDDYGFTETAPTPVTAPKPTAQSRLRADLLIARANYRSGDAAAADAHRIALLASVKWAAQSRERVRVETFNRIVRETGYPRRKIRYGGVGKHLASWVGTVLIMLGALMAHNPFDPSALPPHVTVPLGGAVAAVGAVTVQLARPRKAGEHWKQAPLILQWATLATVLVVGISFDISDAEAPTSAAQWWARAAGAACIVAASMSVGQTIGHDMRAAQLRRQRRTPCPATCGLPEGCASMLDALDEWWENTAPRAQATQPENLEMVHRHVLDRLTQMNLLDAPGEPARADAHPLRDWSER
ncbi:hypothetical protein [Leucobacter sp. cx-169]|uniref:hypothetical protein n=1 Tax=Leucobacter sp. cx-169 TaxID=2770549 RepID=UPI00165E7F81|nr:hypothetical protein [Leucobacter sp. cx-169]MBC9927401.1 hypothetical protein [Leucobacter sp. cx-169]